MKRVTLTQTAATAALAKLGQAGVLSAADHARLNIVSSLLDASQEPKAAFAEALVKMFTEMRPENREPALRNLAKRFRDGQADAVQSGTLTEADQVQLHIQSARQGDKTARAMWFTRARAEETRPRTDDLEAVKALGENPVAPPEWLGRSAAGREPILLFTVNENEGLAVREIFAANQPQPFIHNNRFYEFLCNAQGRPVIHFQTRMGSTLPGAATVRCAEAILDHHPAALLAVGIAFGKKENQQIGDVLVSASVQNYEPQRDNPDREPTSRAHPYEASAAWVQRAAHGPRAAFAMHQGMLLSGEKLIDNDTTRSELFKRFPQAIGGDMEGNGLVAAAEGKIDWLVIKGVSDWADGSKSSIGAAQKQADQILAARHAAQVAYFAIFLKPANATPDTTTIAAPPGPGRPKTKLRPISGGKAVTALNTDTATVANTAMPGAKTADYQALQILIDNLGNHQSMDDTGKSMQRAGNKRPEHKPETNLTAGDTERLTAHVALMTWLKDLTAPAVFALLGEYGMGKTISCQRLYHAIKDTRNGADAPGWAREPLYFDLRMLTLFKDRNRAGNVALPSKAELVNNLITHSWVMPIQGSAPTYETVRASLAQGALLIMDGLDECLVHLTEAQHGPFVRSVLELLTDADPDGSAGARLLVSCRTNFFKTFADQCNLFTNQHRGKIDAQWYTTFLLQPFGQEQINRYLSQVIGDIPLARAQALIAETHNLTELAERPMTLKFIAQHIPRLEALRAAGEAVNSATLYEEVARAWLERDDGKHHLRPEHKMRMLPALAAHLWATGLRSLPYEDLHTWFHTWRRGQADLNELYHPSAYDQVKLEEDLRTASFMVRKDGGPGDAEGFRFAHSSLLEYFLAKHLAQAVTADDFAAWAMPEPSHETLDFLADILRNLADKQAQAGQTTPLALTLNRWRKSYLQQASELLLRYALRHTGEPDAAPHPLLAGFDLRGAKLRDWRFGGANADVPLLPMQGCQWAGADLRGARFERVALDDCSWQGAQLRTASFVGCRAERGQWQDAMLVGTVFQHCRLAGGSWSANPAQQYRAQFVDCQGPPPAHTRGPLVCPVLSQAVQCHTTTVLPHTTAGRAARLSWHAGHLGPVTSVAFSPDGRRLLSGSNDYTLRLWDAASGEELLCFKGHQSAVTSVAFSPDGRHLLSGSGDDTLRLWDAASGEELLCFKGHQSAVTSVAFSPDGRRLLSGSGDDTLRLWDAASGEELLCFKEHQSAVTSVAFSPDGRYLLSGSYDRTLRLWDAASGEELLCLNGHQNPVMSVAFSADGRRLLSGSGDETIRLWDAASGEELLCLQGHQNSVTGVAFSRDGQRLLSGSCDNTLRLWDANSGEELLCLKGHQTWVTSVAFSTDGHRLLSGSNDYTLRLWDAASGEALLYLKRRQGAVTSVAFSTDGRRLLSGSHDDTLRLWDTASGEALVYYQGHQNMVTSVAFSPDGQRLLSGSGDNTLRLWDAASGETLLTLAGHQNKVTSVAFSPDGRRLLSGSDDETLRLWDGELGEEILCFQGHQSGVTSIAFSPDGLKLITGSHDATLRLWNATSGEEILRLKGHELTVWSVAYSPDGRHLLSGSHDGTLRLWDAISGNELLRIRNLDDAVMSVAFSPDGRCLLAGSGDHTLRLWNASSGKELLCLRGHENSVMSVAFSPDGQRLLSGSADGTLCIWDSASGELLRSHWASAEPETEGTAAWEPTRLLHARGNAWRWLVWQVWAPAADAADALGQWTRLPIPSNF